MYNWSGVKKKKTALSAIFIKAKFRKYKDGELIIRAGDTPSGVYFIEKGFVKVYAIEQNGEENLHIIYKEGEIFPIMWALRGVSKDLYYQSLGKTIVKRLSKEEFFESIRVVRVAHMELLSTITTIIDVHADRIENLEIARSYPRIIARLLYMANRFGIRRGKGIIIEPPLNHQDIAASINMTRETASRDLEKLKKKRLISYKGKTISIKNIDKLKEELSSNYEKEPL